MGIGSSTFFSEVLSSVSPGTSNHSGPASTKIGWVFSLGKVGWVFSLSRVGILVFICSRHILLSAPDLVVAVVFMCECGLNLLDTTSIISVLWDWPVLEQCWNGIFLQSSFPTLLVKKRWWLKMELKESSIWLVGKYSFKKATRKAYMTNLCNY